MDKETLEDVKKDQEISEDLRALMKAGYIKRTWRDGEEVFTITERGEKGLAKYLRESHA